MVFITLDKSVDSNHGKLKKSPSIGDIPKPIQIHDDNDELNQIKAPDTDTKELEKQMKNNNGDAPSMI